MRGAPGAGPARETRRTVTILFADVTGSTSLGEQLDPESLRGLMGRYFAQMQAIIERHGGTVEKFIGDAVMAVFGIPTVHEDDALRAVRAAAEIGERLADAERRARGASAGSPSASGPGSTPARWWPATRRRARPWSPATRSTPPPGWSRPPPPARSSSARSPTSWCATPSRSSRGATRAKGKAEPVQAYRLISVTAGAAGHARRLDAPLVGREHGARRLRGPSSGASPSGAARLVTVLGTAGVGKSRLLAEFLARSLSAAGAGRSLPAVWRGDHLLADRRSGPRRGRHRRRRRPGRGAG